MIDTLFYDVQVLGKTVRSFPRAPFVEEGDDPAAKLYRYRVISLPGQQSASTEHQRQPIKIITR